MCKLAFGTIGTSQPGRLSEALGKIQYGQSVTPAGYLNERVKSEVSYCMGSYASTIGTLGCEKRESGKRRVPSLRLACVFCGVLRGDAFRFGGHAKLPSDPSQTTRASDRRVGTFYSRPSECPYPIPIPRSLSTEIRNQKCVRTFFWPRGARSACFRFLGTAHSTGSGF